MMCDQWWAVPGRKFYSVAQLQNLPVDGGDAAAGELRAVTGRAGGGRGEADERREGSALVEQKGEKREKEEQHCSELPGGGGGGFYTNITGVAAGPEIR